MKKLYKTGILLLMISLMMLTLPACSTGDNGGSLNGQDENNGNQGVMGTGDGGETVKNIKDVETVAELLGIITGEDINKIDSLHRADIDVSRDEVAALLNAAKDKEISEREAKANNIVYRNKDFNHTWGAVLHLNQDTASEDDTYELGLYTNQYSKITRAEYRRPGEETMVGYFDDSEIYDMIKQLADYGSEESVDEDAFRKLESWFEESIEFFRNDFEGHGLEGNLDIINLKRVDKFEVSDTSATIEVYEYELAFTPNDPIAAESYLSGGLYMDSQSRIRDVSAGQIACKTVNDEVTNAILIPNVPGDVDMAIRPYDDTEAISEKEKLIEKELSN